MIVECITHYKLSYPCPQAIGIHILFLVLGWRIIPKELD
jgi:hypothetical protein